MPATFFTAEGEVVQDSRRVGLQVDKGGVGRVNNQNIPPSSAELSIFSSIK